MPHRELRDSILHYAKPFHKRLRQQKVRLFLRSVGTVCSGDRLLDVGGGLGIDEEFVSLYATFSEVFIVNLDTHRFDVPKDLKLVRIAADGRNLPFESASIDWVFSNAVIEHVGGWAGQKQFANEIRRVAAKGYFVATPNKYFPIEPHTLLPFYQFLNPKLQRRIVRFSPGYMREPLEINLLSDRDLGRLFPEASVLKIGLPMFPNNLAAVYRVNGGWANESNQCQTAQGATAVLDGERRC